MPTLHLTSVDDVIERLGGTVKVGRRFNRSAAQVSNWRADQRMPAKLYVEMRRALNRRQATAPAHLWGQEESAVA